MTKIKIRKATNSDSEQIISIINTHYTIYGDFVNLNFYDKDLKNIEENYFSKNAYFWIACIDKKIIGTIAILPKSKKTAEIKRIYVSEKFHGKNIGQKLLKTAVVYAKKNNFLEIFLWSDSRYLRAHHFFIKNNFEIIKKQNFFDADNPYQAILFKKKIKRNNTSIDL